MSESSTMRRIRALLAQAEDPAATPAEAEAFSAKAHEMMVRYSIDHAMIEATKPGTRETPIVRSFPAEQGYGKPKMFLLAGIAKAFATNVVRRQKGDVITVEIIGFESDLDFIDTLYTSLLLQGTSALAKQPRSDRSFRTSFWYGFANRTAARAEDTFKRVEREAVETEAGTALVLANRADDVSSAAAEHYAGRRMRAYSGGKVTSRAGRDAGVEAANRADLGRTRVGGGHRALA